jgi:hypothetical protein
MLNCFIDAGTGFSYLHSLSFSDSVYDIQWKLNTIHQDWRSDARHIERACALAGLLYVECFLRDVNPCSTVVARLRGACRFAWKKQRIYFKNRC